MTPNPTKQPHAQSDSANLMVQQLGRLLEISLKLNSTQDITRLLESILQTATDVLACEAASIMLYDEKTGQLLFTAATGSNPDELAKIPVPLEGSLAGAIFTQNQPLLINDVAQDPRHFAKVGKQVAFQTRSLLGVPMVMRDKVTGVLEALNKEHGTFTEKDTRLLSIIASQAAVAIHNATLLQALQKANEELERADKLKSDFMAIASHELRTPLGIILGYASFLKEETQGELSDHAERVLASAMHMRTLIEDMTNMNLMRLGSLEMALRLVSIQSVLREALEEVRSAIELKGHRVFIQGKNPAYVMADPEKLKLVFVNLFSNAIRFTPNQGEIHLDIRTEHEQVWVRVRDNGIGIPPGELEAIFDEFYQVESHLVRHQGGLGLGLSIARGLVTLHKGRIWAESEGTGKGAALVVTLPAAKEKEA